MEETRQYVVSMEIIMKFALRDEGSRREPWAHDHGSSEASRLAATARSSMDGILSDDEKSAPMMMD